MGTHQLAKKKVSVLKSQYNEFTTKRLVKLKFKVEERRRNSFLLLDVYENFQLMVHQCYTCNKTK